MDIPSVKTELIRSVKDKPVTSASEIADTLDMDRRRVSEALQAISAVGDAESIKVGARARVWWPEPHPWRQSPQPDQSIQDQIKSVVGDWSPGRSSDERSKRREVGVKVLELAREKGEIQRQDALDALYPDCAVGDVTADTFWRRQARPALEQGVEAGVIEQDARKWRWNG